MRAATTACSSWPRAKRKRGSTNAPVSRPRPRCFTYRSPHQKRPEVRTGEAALTAGRTNAGGDAKRHRPRTTRSANRLGVRGLGPRTFPREAAKPLRCESVSFRSGSARDEVDRHGDAFKL